MIIDSFLDSFSELKGKSINGEFIDEVNPVDGVVYPLICKDVPKNVEGEIVQKLSELIGRPISNQLMFMRRSPKGVNCPHKVHSDISMGRYSLMLYINDTDDESYGTSLVKHKSSGIAYSPESEVFLNVITDDQNNDDAWETLDMVKMKANRAFIFKADSLHRAEPVGGFGQNEEARVVLTCFFS